MIPSVQLVASPICCYLEKEVINGGVPVMQKIVFRFWVICFGTSHVLDLFYGLNV